MVRAFFSIAALLISAAILLSGGGLHGTLTAVRADLEGYSFFFIGLMTSFYFFGFISGCYWTPRLIANVGHIRCFAAFAAMLATVILVQGLFVNGVIWLGLRVFAGIAYAGLYVIIESWLNEKATNANRGKLLSLYRIVDFVSLSIGQFLLLAADPQGITLFILVAILISLSIIPVALTRVESPTPPDAIEFNPFAVWKVSPLGFIGAFAVGLTNGGFWAIGPVFVGALGYGIQTVSLFMSLTIMFGATAQWPIGYLSDIFDRRIVLLLVSFIASIAGLFLFLYSSAGPLYLLAGAAFYGAASMPIFGLSAAHANDFADEGEFVAVSSSVLFVYGLGSIAGPLIATFAMQLTAPQSLFGFTALIHILLVGFGAYRMFARSASPLNEQLDYVAIPRTTPAVFEIDPRGPDE